MDPAGGKLYYTLMRNTSSINVMNLDGSNNKVFQTLNAAADPFGVGFDPVHQMVYWSTYFGGNTSLESIQRERADGTGGIQTIYKPTDVMGGGFDFDSINQAIYFGYGRDRPWLRPCENRQY